MEDTTQYVRALETKITRHQTGKGYLEVHTKTLNGEKIMEAFTLASLADVLDMPMTTMEGRYARARLSNWKVDIPTNSGRPARGFPLAMLQEVVFMIRTPGAFVKHTPNGDSITKAPRPEHNAPLVPTYHLNKPYYTLPAMADHFGFSVTTIRNKLQKAGLIRRLVNLGSSQNGGRPTRAMPASAIGDVKMAVVDGVTFDTEFDRIIAATGGQRDQAKAEMAEAVVPHIPPLPDSIRAWDHETKAPVIPLNAVNTPRSTPLKRQFDTEKLVAECMEELEAIMAKAAPPAFVETPLEGSGATPTVLETSAPTAHDHSAGQDGMTDEEKSAMVAMQRRALVEMADEPTDEEYRDTAYMLRLEGEEADRFIEEVRAARAKGSV